MKAWAIKHWRGGLYIDTVRRTRREAIDTFLQNFFRGSASSRRKKWNDDRKYHVHRVVRVNVETD